jgi:hypothetical protein
MPISHERERARAIVLGERGHNWHNDDNIEHAVKDAIRAQQAMPIVRAIVVESEMMKKITPNSSNLILLMLLCVTQGNALH